MPDPARPGRLRSRLRLIALLAVVAIGGGAVLASVLRPVPVTATPVVRGKAIDAVYATGTVEAEDRVLVKAKSSGSIAEILVKEGAVVKKGDLLARIDNPVVAFDLKRGQADLQAAAAQAGPAAPQIAALAAQQKGLEAELGTAQQDLARVEKLAATGALPQSDLDRARSRVTQVESSVSASQAQQRAARIDLNAAAAQKAAQVQSLASRVADTEVRAPLDGVVLAKSVEIGEVVSINQPLFKVGDVRSLILEVAVDEADIARVHTGGADAAPAAGASAGATPASIAAVSLYAFPKQIFAGKVFDILPDANRDRKAFLVKVRLDQPPPGLRSGMSAEVNIIAQEREGSLLAPSEAESDGAVWLVQGGKAHRQPIQIGVRDLLRVEVTGGVGEGDLVVVEGQDKLSEGKRVGVTVRPADKATPLPDRSQPPKSAL